MCKTSFLQPINSRGNVQKAFLRLPVYIALDLPLNATRLDELSSLFAEAASLPLHLSIGLLDWFFKRQRLPRRRDEIVMEGEDVTKRQLLGGGIQGHHLAAESVLLLTSDEDDVGRVVEVQEILRWV
jgi:hypothetical protein